jgi:hypothetical protein
LAPDPGLDTLELDVHVAAGVEFHPVGRSGGETASKFSINSVES